MASTRLERYVLRFAPAYLRFENPNFFVKKKVFGPTPNFYVPMTVLSSVAPSFYPLIFCCPLLWPSIFFSFFVFDRHLVDCSVSFVFFVNSDVFFFSFFQITANESSVVSLDIILAASQVHWTIPSKIRRPIQQAKNSEK